MNQCVVSAAENTELDSEDWFNLDSMIRFAAWFFLPNHHSPLNCDSIRLRTECKQILGCASFAICGKDSVMNFVCLFFGMIRY